MHDKVFAFFDAAVVGIPVLSFCVYQIWSVNREIAADKRKSEEAARHAVGEHRLDDG